MKKVRWKPCWDKVICALVAHKRRRCTLLLESILCWFLKAFSGHSWWSPHHTKWILSEVFIKMKVTKTESNVALSITQSKVPSLNSIALISISKSFRKFVKKADILSLTFEARPFVLVLLIHGLEYRLRNVNVGDILVSLIVHLFAEAFQTLIWQLKF